MPKKLIKSTNPDIEPINDVELRLIRVLADPANHGKTIAEKCKIAGLTRDSYYRYIKRPSFLRKLNDAVLTVLRENSPEILDAAIQVAKRPDYKGHADRKMLLEMLNLYTPKSINAQVTIDREYSIEEIDARIEELVREIKRLENVEVTDFEVKED